MNLDDYFISQANTTKEIKNVHNSKKEISMTHIVIFADESFKFKNHLQIDTVKCYAYKNGLQFHFFGFNKTTKCKHDDVL